MAERRLIGLTDVRTLAPGAVIWDAGKGAVAGFGARRQRDSVAYVLKYRTEDGRQRWHTIGRHGAPWTPETARKEAKRLLGEVVKGTDPAAEKREKRKAATMAELCNLYWQDAEAGNLITRLRTPKKAGTLISDKGRIERHIKPLLGTMRVAAVTRADVEGFMKAVAAGKTAARAKTGKKHGLSNVRGGRGVASRTVGLLGGIFTYAVEHGMRADNPVRGVRRPADDRRERRLRDDEYAALGKALRRAEAEAVWPAAVACVRFLALTGWRSGEAIGLRLDDVDLACRTVRLANTKTGASMRPLSHAACDVITGLGRSGDLVFPPTRGAGTMAGFRKFWARIAKLGGLPGDITPHTLRHSFASLASDLRNSVRRRSARCSGTRDTPSRRATSTPPTRCCSRQPMPWPGARRN